MQYIGFVIFMLGGAAADEPTGGMAAVLGVLLILAQGRKNCKAIGVTPEMEGCRDE